MNAGELSKVRVGLRFGGDAREVAFKIIGMHCAACSLTVQRALLSVEGVIAATVSLATDEARVVVDPRRFDYSKALKAVQRAGYDIYRERVTFILRSLGPEESQAVVDAVKMPGVFSALPNPMGQSLTVEYNPLELSIDDIKGSLERAGFHIIDVVGEQGDFDVDRRAVELDMEDLLNRLLVALPLTAAVFMLMVLRMVGVVGSYTYAIFSMILATPVQFYSGLRFLSGSIRAFRNRTANMDTLVALGTLSAYAFSILVMLRVLMGEVFFDSSAAIVTFILIGRYLETRTRLSLSSAVRELARLQPAKARLLEDSREVTVDVSQLKPGDLVIVKEGEAIPADGIVIDGDGYVDEASMTGEPRPIHKVVNDVVLAGTRLVRGYLVFSVTRSGKYTLLAQLIRTVRQAQAFRLPIQTLVDKVAAAFTWIVIAVSLATFTAWILLKAPVYVAVMHMAAVLVVACPCALGLATPASIVAGTGRAAQKGLLVRNPNAVERAEEVRVVAFDKTGTLTKGSFRVVSVIGGEDVVKLAAIAEQGSPHPVARAIVEYASGLGITIPRPESFDSVPGMGVVAQWNGHSIGVGNERLVKGFGLGVPSDVKAKLNEYRGYTVVYVVVDDKLAGAIVVGDEVRDEAWAVINELRGVGIDIALLTGDNEAAATAIAERLGIPVENVYAGLTPDDKVRVVDELRRKYGAVMMVGDGINDAAALSVADVGIAMGGGTDVAKSAGDVILVRDDLRGVVDFLKISRKIMNNVRLNLAYVFAYNSILIPVAAGVVPGLTLSPMWAGLAMALSSITITLNALRLRRA